MYCGGQTSFKVQSRGHANSSASWTLIFEQSRILELVLHGSQFLVVDSIVSTVVSAVTQTGYVTFRLATVTS